MIKITIATLSILLGIGLALPDSVDASGCGLTQAPATCASHVSYMRPGQVRRAHRRAGRRAAQAQRQALRNARRGVCAAPVASTCSAPVAATTSAPVAATTSAPMVVVPDRVIAPRLCVLPRRSVYVATPAVEVQVAAPCCE